LSTSSSIAPAGRGLRQVTRVMVEVGVAAGIEPDALRFCFDVVAEGTPARGAELAIERIALQARCRECACEFEPVRLVSPCPSKGIIVKKQPRGQSRRGEFRTRIRPM
jgi:hydrogenase nickel incorporation protein HypA/HybF